MLGGRLAYAAGMPATRPPIWVGHIRLTVRDPRRALEFYATLGMHTVWAGEDMAIAELRGGTHLLLFAGEPTGGAAPFDLMVEDLHAAHTRYLDAGLEVSAVAERAGEHHHGFSVVDPDGHRISVYDDHTQGVT